MVAGVAAAAVNEESSVIDELYDVHSQFRGFVAEKCFHEEKVLSSVSQAAI